MRKPLRALLMWDRKIRDKNRPAIVFDCPGVTPDNLSPLFLSSIFLSPLPVSDVEIGSCA